MAITGETGSAKSTLLRLALGLEKPSGGAVYVDGRDLARLDPRTVRRSRHTFRRLGTAYPGSLGRMRNSRILFLAETTSWLDARSQPNVMENSHGLAVTRIVVTHLLSTIRRADRIYALSAGHIIQEGSFDELFEQEGLFQ